MYVKVVGMMMMIIGNLSTKTTGYATGVLMLAVVAFDLLPVTRRVAGVKVVNGQKKDQTQK